MLPAVVVNQVRESLLDCAVKVLCVQPGLLVLPKQGPDLEHGDAGQSLLGVDVHRCAVERSLPGVSALEVHRAHVEALLGRAVESAGVEHASLVLHVAIREEGEGPPVVPVILQPAEVGRRVAQPLPVLGQRLP